MYLWELIKGLGKCFFTGVTFGALTIPEIFSDWNKSQKFVIFYAKGYATFSTIYFFTKGRIFIWCCLWPQTMN